MLLANPSREVAWRRIVYLGMQLIHRAAKRKNKICFVKAWWIWENVYLNTSSFPKVAYFSDLPFRTVVNFRNCFPTSWQSWYTTSPLSFSFFLMNVNLQHFSLFFVKIESRCCRIFTYPGTESYVMLRRLIGNFNVVERLKLKFVQLLARWEKRMKNYILKTRSKRDDIIISKLTKY